MPTKRGQCRPTDAWIEAYKGARGTTYRVRWVDPRTGKRQATSCGRDKAHARQVRDAKKAELREGLSGRLPNKTVAELKAQLATFMAGKSSHTIRKTRRSLADLIDHCGDRLLVHVDRGMMMEFRSKRLDGGVAMATVNKDLRQIKSTLSYAVDAGWLRINPLWRWKAMQMREPEKRIRVVEAEEFTELLIACRNPTLRVLLRVAFHQGLRRTELVNLRWAAVDFARGVLRVENHPEAGELTKSRKNRVLPMHAIVRSELAALRDDVATIIEGGQDRPKSPHCFTWEDGRPYRADWVTHQFSQVVKRSSVEYCTLHDLRRSFSTLAQRAGVDRHVVKDLGGWSTVGVVEKHYTGEVSESLERAMRTIQRAQGVA